MHPSPNSRKFKLLFLLLASPLFFFGQSLTGLWTGALSTDSNTIRKDQLFEIALTEYRGKVYGYSRSEFIVNDTLYYILKRVKGTINGDVCEVVDDEIIAYNFPGKLDKGIKVTSTFRRNQSDSTWYLAGTWKTNATKKYYALTGKVDLQEEKDLTASKIFPHLEELKMADQVAFYKDKKEGIPVVMKRVKPEMVRTEYRSVTIEEPVADKKSFDPKGLQKPVNPIEEKVAIGIQEEKKEEKNEVTINKTPAETGNKDQVIAKADKPVNAVKNEQDVKEKAKPVTVTTEPVVKDIATDNKVSPTTKDVAINKEEIKTRPEIKKEVTPNKESVTKTTAPANKDVVIVKEEVKSTITAPAKKEEPVVKKEVEVKTPEVKKIEPSIAVKKDLTGQIVVKSNQPIEQLIQQTRVIGGRNSEFSQEVLFKSDSLELALYDNGEIDGDTVSVYINGEMIMAKQGLKSLAIKKTIYMNPGDPNDFTLVLFADNLGKYPPNTGLLVVHDGEDIYHLRFSSDLQKSSGIVFKRKK